MTLLGLLQRCLGTIVQARGGLGGECVDWINVYLQSVLGQTGIQKNAVDWATVEVNGFTWTVNGATNYPHKGAIVVWGQNQVVGTGPNGHIALCIAADPMHLLAADQNWPDGAPVSIIEHSYAGVLGWHEPS